MTAVLYLLLAAVAVFAGVLSFDALHTLALACGYAPALAWMLPLVVDAGAAAGTLAWLARTGRARTFGRTLALVLLVGSVTGNALSHGLAAHEVAPAWWLASLVSAVSPTVLAAVVHLAVLAGRAPARQRASDGSGEARDDRAEELGDGEEPSAAYPGVLVDDRGLSRLWETAPPAVLPPAAAPAGKPGDDRAAELIAAGAGRRRLARELGVTEHEARQLLAEHRPGVTS